ncbi:hypothetical protein [Streptomyces incanus]|uniref:Ribbon-helix-helix protein CopG domain-containing protein n=1 Tax=Streptomyces incanus TaxID=887453 RepID=A0ABW0XHN1_9ACTN
MSSTTRITVTLPGNQVTELRKLTGNASGYVAESVARRIRRLTEPGRQALATTLTDTESAGHDPAEAAERRELGTADSISDVLVWRLRRLADLPADATTMPDHTLCRRAVSPAPSQDDRPRRMR